MSIAVVWLKRDLRLSDHQALLSAHQSGLPVVLLYCFEPMLHTDPHYDQRHWRFVKQSLTDIQARIPNGALICLQLNALDALKQLDSHCNITQLFSYQEVGLDNTFKRDRAVKQWCNEQQITFKEAPVGAVIRGLTNRIDWDSYWKKVMRASQADVDLLSVNWFTTGACYETTAKLIKPDDGDHVFQQGGELAAHDTLASFFDGRGQSYPYSLSSPELSQQHCSRLSAYLAWGNVSLRQVYQTLLGHWKRPGWRRTLTALSSRLHWHCHFIQKFESESSMQFVAVNRGYEQLPRVSGELQEQRLDAWKSAKTGIPMVDACMRSLHQTGYLNFRMRAMLVSFLCHHLAVDWRHGVQHLARLFLDFEPGIHYSQFQMQAGVTGINTIRIYNPVKQGQEKDSEGVFVKKWLPELAEIPVPLLHSPWELSAMEQLMYNLELGKDYPYPIVDLKQSYAQAQDLLWQWRKRPEVRREAGRLLERHVRPR
jgi:deoxyribodipyrimidine photo-lyase